MWSPARINTWPFLFLVSINDLLNVTSLFSILHAGDTNMFDSGKDLDKLIDNMNSELNNICDWYNDNKLSLNANKIHFMIWAPRATAIDLLKPFVICGHEIDEACNAKFLGIVLDDRLNWNHTSGTKNKTGKAIGILERRKNYIGFPLWWVCSIVLFKYSWCILYMLGVKHMLQT